MADESARRAEKQSVQKQSSRAVVIAGLVFGVGMGVFFGFTSGRWLHGLVLGGCAGALFAAIMAFFVSRSARGDRALFGEVEPIPPDEAVLHDGAANHFKGLEGVGGKLHLTSRRLRFVAHKLNVQVHDTSWPLEEIERAETSRTLFVIPNGLRLTLKDGRRERFVVYGNRAWVEAIDQARQALR